MATPNQHQTTLRVGKKSIKLTIFENEDTVTLFLGGHDVFCIDAFLYKPDSPFVKYGCDVTKCVLSHIYHNHRCSLEHDFQKGIDTKMILRLLISYIQLHYPYIRTLSFTDTSFRTCENGQHIELAEMSYIRTGKTWYESNFYAYLEEPYASTFRQADSIFQEHKKFFTWEMMKSFILSDLPLPETDMKTMFETASTWQEFFGPLSNKIGIPEFCIFVAQWLHRFLHLHMRYSFTSAKYQIPLDSIETIEFKESEYMRGGKRFTRRTLRQHPMNYT